MQDYIKCQNISHRNEPFEFLGYKIFTCITYAIVYLYKSVAIYVDFIIIIFLSLVLNKFQIYKFWNSQSWSVILHRMYFHWRSLQKSKTEANESTLFKKILFLSVNLITPKAESWATVEYDHEHEHIQLCSLHTETLIYTYTYLTTPLKVVWAPRMK